MRKLIGKVAILVVALGAAAASSPLWADTNITEYVKLTEDADWSSLGTVNIAAGAGIHLNGRNLTVSGFSGSGSFYSSAVLPAGYAVLEYVDSTGAQYIDTGIAPTAAAKVDAEVAYIGGTANAYEALLCSSVSDVNNTQTAKCYGLWVWPNSGNKWSVMFNGTTYNSSAGVANGTKCHLVAAWSETARTLMVDGTSQLNNTKKNTPTSTGNTMYMPAWNSAGTLRGMGKFRFYSVKIYNPQDTLKRNYVPAKRLSDNAVGFYDMVSKTFSPSATETAFVDGPEVERGGGELRINVASGTFQNSTVAISNSVKVVKTGAGTFVSALSQSYTGGNLIVGGVAMPPQGGGTSHAYMPSEGWTGFGNYAAQDAAAAIIRVNTNAVFDINGVYGFCKYKIILNGGMLRNSVAEDYYKNARPGVVIHSLEADSFADFQQNTRYWDGTAADAAPCNLNGFTLKLSIGSGRYVGVSSSFTNGTLEYLTGGYFYPVYVSNYTPSFIDMSTVDFVQSAALNIGTETRVRDYMCKYTGSSCSGSAAFKVFGTFTPVSQKFYGATMQNGSAINLSEKDGAFSTTSGFSAQKLKYAADATITLITGGRRLRTGDQLMSWVSGAEPDATVKFVPQPDLARAWRFEVRADGVYAVRRKGFMILVK